MALDNLITVEFTEEELATINEAIDNINTVLEGKAVNLTPDERRQYGSIADRNKNIGGQSKVLHGEIAGNAAQNDRQRRVRSRLRCPRAAGNPVAQAEYGDGKIARYENVARFR